MISLISAAADAAVFLLVPFHLKSAEGTFSSNGKSKFVPGQRTISDCCFDRPKDCGYN